jgi:hypothetical protein
MSQLAQKVLRLFELFDCKEESESSRVFHPTTIGSCRTMHVVELDRLLPEIKRLAQEEISEPVRGDAQGM